MSDDDHSLIAQTGGILTHTYDGVVVVHGTDTLTTSGELTSASSEASCPNHFTARCALRAEKHRCNSKHDRGIACLSVARPWCDRYAQQNLQFRRQRCGKRNLRNEERAHQ